MFGRPARFADRSSLVRAPWFMERVFGRVCEHNWVTSVIEKTNSYFGPFGPGASRGR